MFFIIKKRIKTIQNILKNEFEFNKKFNYQ